MLAYVITKKPVALSKNDRAGGEEEPEFANSLRD